jgi:peptidoglycan/LPS O-acetylase OafA/YrhL
MLRALAAFEVFGSHWRSFLLVDWGDVSARGPASAGLYLATGFSHQAVVVFFVLSGFLVGGNALEAFQTGRWSSRRYSIRRLTRLWIVLIPALVLTWLWHCVFRQLGVPGPSSGAHDVANHIADFTLSTFVGNVFFLQTIVVPTYGNNDPLWSLANEFWYYVVFPLGLNAWFGRGAARVISAVAALAICWWLPWSIISAGAIWLLGVAAFRLARTAERWSRARVLSHRALAFAAIAGSLVATKFGHWFGSDYVLGACVAATLPSLAVHAPRARAYRKLVNVAADASYTLYLTHFPLLYWGRVLVAADHRLQPTASGLGIYVLGLAATLLYTLMLWWLFERRTPAVARFIQRCLYLPAARRPPLASRNAETLSPGIE